MATLLLQLAMCGSSSSHSNSSLLLLLCCFFLPVTLGTSDQVLDNVIAPPLVILLPRPASTLSASWCSAIRLRNGNVVFIAKDTLELAVVNNNLYVFQTQNLYYYDNAAGVALFLTYLVPGHAPLGLAWQYVHDTGGVEVEGEGVLIYTATCVLRLWIKAPDFWVNPRVSILAGHCYETTFPRDGLPTFARFTQIQHVTSSCSSSSGRHECAMLVLDSAVESRLALLQGGMVQSITLPVPALAVSLWGISTVAVAWTGGGISLFAFFDTKSPQQTRRWGQAQEWLALSVLDANHVFALSRQGTLERFSAEDEGIVLGLTPFKPVPGYTQVALDFPYGLFVLDIARQSFYLAPNLGCLCPPGHASIAQIENQHCQPAPAGGYVDVLGRFVPCPPGTFGTLSLATAQQTCAPCPPSTISNQSQSTRCALCPPGTLADPSRTTCVSACPPGTTATSHCVPCPVRGQTFVDNQCIACPPGMYTDPSRGQYTCATCPGPSPPCPLLVAATTTTASNNSVTMTIAMLGVRPVDMAVSRANGTIYVAAFQTLITVGHSGNALEIILPEFALVRGIALGPNEKVLYAAVTQAPLLCIAFADAPRFLRKWYWPAPNAGMSAVLVGIRLLQGVDTVVWDAASNALRTAAGAAAGSTFTPPSGGEIMAFTTFAERQAIFMMYREMSSGHQTILMLMPGANSSNTGILARNTDPSTAWNPYMTMWQDRLVLSSYNALLLLLNNNETVGAVSAAGLRNVSGRVDADTASGARFTSPGPMAEAPNTNMLLVTDQNGLRLVFLANSSSCPEGYYYDSKQQKAQCWPCPEGWISMRGSQTCTACTQGQFTNPGDGACVPCPRMRWWAADLPCAPIVDTMVAADASGLTLNDMVGELLLMDMSVMQQRDYVSLQTLVLPVPMDAVLLDAAANARFWARSQRVTPPPEVYVSGELLDLHLELELPGFWVACSQYVLEIEPCSCQLPAGGILLGNRDMNTLWNRARAKAAAIDYSTLLVTMPPDPDLFLATGGIEEAVHFRESFNISTSSALFVARTDAGGGTDDDNPNVLFFESVDVDMSVSVQPTPAPTPSQSAFAACVAGWPATYVCPAGFLWVPPLFTCVPCRPGFYYFATTAACVPCPKGSFSPKPASTACSLCPTAREQGQSACNTTEGPSSSDGGTCPAGSELRNVLGQCLPCLPGYSKAVAGSAYCMPCAPGQYADRLGKTACVQCPAPLVSTQWGSSACTPCPLGSVPSKTSTLCAPCAAKLEFFADGNRCLNKTVFQCKAGFYLEDGGLSADNRCVPCLPCAEGTLMVPFSLNPCQTATHVLGPPYRCVPLRSVAGQFSRLSVNELNSSAFDVQYTPCQGLPPFAAWTEGPSPAYCYFQCNYAVMGPSRRQYLFYYSMEKQDAQTQDMLQHLQPTTNNRYPLDYPGLAVDLMLLSQHVCMPCPNTPCPLGKWRPILEGCGPPVCTIDSCQVMEAGPVRYDKDGCVMNCSWPSNAHVTGPAPLGMGDACPWQCDYGFYMELVMVDLDANETGFVCRPCSPSACVSGTELYRVADCLPTSQRSAFCIRCPSSNLAVPVPTAGDGQCKYACQPNVSYQSSLDSQCKPCLKGITCPSGNRLVCAEQPCAPCPPLPMALWSSAVTMPSSTEVCQAACRDGFHTLDAVTRAVLLPPAFSYDPSTILCAPCSQRPSLPCPARACPTGYFMQVPGSGLCSRCPTDYDCGLGQFPSSCVCTQCPPPPLNFMPILASQALKLNTDYNSSVSIRCSMVCTWNTMLILSACVPCNTLNTQMPTYSVWNASNGTRWWPASQDPPHLPPRSLASVERRAGLCWPCPPGTITLPGDADLCLSPAPQTVSTQVVPVSNDGGVVFSSYQSTLLMSSRQLLSTPVAGVRRRGATNQVVVVQHHTLCPPFASGVYPNCQCNPGFTLDPNGQGCVFEQRCSQHHHLILALHPHANKAQSSLRLVNHAPAQCPPPRNLVNGSCASSLLHRSALTTTMDISSSSNCCSPGHMRDSASGLCVPCPRGSYSPSYSMAPCLPCPPGTTTVSEQSLVRAHCVLRLDADYPFVGVS